METEECRFPTPEDRSRREDDRMYQKPSFNYLGLPLLWLSSVLFAIALMLFVCACVNLRLKRRISSQNSCFHKCGEMVYNERDVSFAERTPTTEFDLNLEHFKHESNQFIDVQSLVPRIREENCSTHKANQQEHTMGLDTKYEIRSIEQNQQELTKQYHGIPYVTIKNPLSDNVVLQIIPYSNSSVNSESQS